MGHPLIDEFCRQSSTTLKPEFYRRCQRVFLSEVQPLLDERDVLLAENAALKAQLASLQQKATRRRAESVV